MALTLAMATGAANANNIQVSTATLTELDSIAGTVRVQFDLTWENSWRTSSAPNNWDAAWVFVKYRNATTGVWHHARLHGDIGHTAPAGTTISTGLLTPGSPFEATSNWGVGAFIHRSADGSGTFSPNGIELRWNYGTQVPAIDYADIAEVKVLAIEMVYVLEGPYALGTNGGDQYRFRKGNDPSAAFQVTSENAIVLGTGSGQLWAEENSNVTDGSTLPAAYPKGFAAFYMHKYEITQQAYVDFLNTLTYTQQAARTSVAPNSPAGTGALSSTNDNRNGIDIEFPGMASSTPAVYACNLNSTAPFGGPDDGQWLPCNYTSTFDWQAYLDWSGLRLMTELEYEKACRGPLPPVNSGFAWGTSGITGTNSTPKFTLGAPGTATESIATNFNTTGTVGNAINYYSAPTAFEGPLRVGIFAANVDNDNDRVRAGASYYGILELTGNLWERTVLAGLPSGQSYTGLHGDGTLSTGGTADVSQWPNPYGSNWKGGAYNGPKPEQQVSDRQVGVNDSYSVERNAISGMRGVRSF